MSDTMMGTYEAETRVRKMLNQSNNGRIEYPSGTNMRGSGGREHHATGDMVGREAHACGDQVGKKKNTGVGDVMSAPGRGGSRMKPNFGAPPDGHTTKTRAQAIRQVHGENHKIGDRVGSSLKMAGRGLQKAGNKAVSTAKKAPSAINKVADQAASGMRKAGNQAVSGLRKAGNSLRSSMPPRPMFRRGGRPHDDMED